MKKISIVLVPSLIILIAIWFPFHMESISESSTVIENSGLNEIPIYAMRTSTSDWREAVTWIIGSINTIFATIVLGRKVFERKKE